MRTRPFLVAMSALALLLAACGGDGQTVASPSASVSVSGSPPPPAETTSPTGPTGPGSPSGSPSGPDSPSDSPSDPTSPRPSATSSPSPTGQLEPEVAVFLALCSVGAEVATEDLGSAETTFQNEVHDALHDLADDLEEVDRGLSALLLQAKSKVEADFAEKRPDPATLAAHLAELTRATEAGLRLLDIDSPGCPDQPQ